MKHILILTLLLLTIHGANAGNRMYLDFKINDSAKLKLLDEAINIGLKMKLSLRNLKKNKQDSPHIKKMEKQLKIYEEQMHKTYGFIPGLRYQMVPTSGSIYILVPENKVSDYIKQGVSFKAGTPAIEVTNKKGEKIKCFKVLLKKLSTQDNVNQFNQTLLTANKIRQQIQSLEVQIEKKPDLKKEPTLLEGMKRLKETLKELDNKLQLRYGVLPHFKYIFEPESGAVYLNLSEESLRKLGEINKGN